jgi:hypothetical protein
MRKLVLSVSLSLSLLLAIASPDLLAESVLANDCTKDVVRTTNNKVVFNECNGEEMFLTLKRQRILQQCVAEDGTVTVKVSIQEHGSGIGAITGNRYVLSFQDKTLTVNPHGCPSVITDTSREMAISKGSLPNSKLVRDLTFTFGCDGSLSVDEEFRSDCPQLN